MTLWGGRFGRTPLRGALAVHGRSRRPPSSVDDVTGSLAHVAMLGEAGILPGEDVANLTDGLRRILAEAEADEFGFVDGDEDVHSAVERRLVELIGEVGGKLHTGRSRNDQVALDLRLYLRRASSARAEQIGAPCPDAWPIWRNSNADVVVPVFTHLQQAQPISFGHHLLAHAWSLLRDRDRILGCMARLDVSPLGAGAAGGSSLPLRPDTVMSGAGHVSDVRQLDRCRRWARRGDRVRLLLRPGHGWPVPTGGRTGVVGYQRVRLGHLRRADGDRLLGTSAETEPRHRRVGAGAGPPRSSATSLLSSHCKRGCRSPTSVTCRRTRHWCSMRTTRWRRRSRRSAPCSPAPDSIHLYLRQRPRRSTLPSGSPGEACPSVGPPGSRTAGGGRSRRMAATSLRQRPMTSAATLFEPEDLAVIDPGESVARRLSPGGGSVASVHHQIAALRRRLSL